MSRTWDGATNYIRCSPGACGPVGTGAYTTVSLVKLDLFAGASALLTGRVGATNGRGAIITGHLAFGPGDFSDGFGPVTEDAWWWVVQQKTAGSAHYEWAIAQYPVTDTADIVFGESNNSGNHGDPGTLTEIWLGEADIHGRGTHALDVMYAAHLTQAQIKAGLTTALADLMALSPVGCWPLNQASSADPVADVTGGGADEVETIGTVGFASNPPGYDFSLTVPPATGTANLGLGLALAGTGHTHHAGTRSLGLALTLAGAGHRRSRGTANLTLATTLAGQGIRASSGTAHLGLALRLTGGSRTDTEPDLDLAIATPRTPWTVGEPRTSWALGAPRT